MDALSLALFLFLCLHIVAEHDVTPRMPLGYDIIVKCFPVYHDLGSFPMTANSQRLPRKKDFVTFETWKQQKQSNLAEEGRRREKRRNANVVEEERIPRFIRQESTRSTTTTAATSSDVDEEGWTKEDRDILDREAVYEMKRIQKPSYTPSDEEAARTISTRFNFASLDCAASIVSTNPEAKHAAAILTASKDHYMLNKCNAKQKWVEVELCEEILVEAVQIANFELFSSSVKEFAIHVSAERVVERYTNDGSKKNGHGWTLLGHFRAENNRHLQVYHDCLY